MHYRETKTLNSKQTDGTENDSHSNSAKFHTDVPCGPADE